MRNTGAPRTAAIQKRLERHAAERARPRPDLNDLGMHRARVLRTRDGNFLTRVQKLGRVLFEAVEAALGAEIVADAIMIDRANRLIFFDRHPADGIDV